MNMMKCAGKMRDPSLVLLLDNHYDEGIPGMLSRVNPKQVLADVKKAGFTGIGIQAKCHWGNCYYPTKIGHIHRALVNRDLLGEYLDEAGRIGLERTVYYSVRLDGQITKSHPNWQSVDKHGQPYPGINKSTFLCLNTPYENYVLAHIEEIARGYDFSRLLLDIVFYKSVLNPQWGAGPCYCLGCKQAWQRDFREVMPKEITADKRERYYDFKSRIILRFMQRVKKMLRDTGKTIETIKFMRPPYAEDEIVGREAEASPESQQAPFIYARICKDFGLPFMMSYRLSIPDWVAKSEHRLVYDTTAALANGSESILYWASPDLETNSYSSGLYRRVKKVFARTSPLLKKSAFGLKPYAEIGLCYSLKRNELAVAEKGWPANLLPGDMSGALRTCLRRHLPVITLPEEHLKEKPFNGLKVLFLGGEENIAKPMQKDVLDFLRGGGKVICWTNSFLPRALKAFRISPFDKDGHGYIDLGADADVSALYIGTPCKISALAPGVKPLFFFRPAVIDTFCRPGRKTQFPLVVSGHYGRGQYVYFAFDIFSLMLKSLGEAAGELVDVMFKKLHYAPAIRVEAPGTVEVSFHRSEQGLRVIVINSLIEKTMGIDEGGYCWTDFLAPIQVSDAFVELREMRVKGARALNGSVLKRSYDGAKTKVYFGAFKDHAVADIEVLPDCIVPDTSGTAIKNEKTSAKIFYHG